jgi:hypothetical protein
MYLICFLLLPPITAPESYSVEPKRAGYRSLSPAGGACHRTAPLLGDSRFWRGSLFSRHRLRNDARQSAPSGFSSHYPTHNGFIANQMSSESCLSGFGTLVPTTLRKYTRADAYRGLLALASLSMAGIGS